MNRNLLIALSATAALAAPLAAQAQSTASSTVTINGDVAQACLIGQPTAVTLSLGDLTGPDGKLTTALLGSGVAATTTIDVAWCNTPSTLSLDGSPLTLTSVPGYATPAGFARFLTYNATLTGWPTPLVDRPVIGDAAKTVDAASAHAASPSLVLDISSLQTLNADGTAEASGAVLEAGSYAGSVVVSVAAQ